MGGLVAEAACSPFFVLLCVYIGTRFDVSPSFLFPFVRAFSAAYSPRSFSGIRALFFLGLSVAAASPAFAQREVRHLNAASAVIGLTPSGRYYQGTYGRFISDKLRFEAAGVLEQGPRAGADGGPQGLNYRAYELALGFAPRIARLGEVVYLRLPFQVRTRYERRPATGPFDSDGFAVGPSLGLSAEVYLVDRVSVSGEFRQSWYVLGSPVNHLPRYFGGGLTFYLGQ